MNRYTIYKSENQNIIVRMIWFITERRILSRIAKKRYEKFDSDTKSFVITEDTPANYDIRAYRRVRGIEKTLFYSDLIQDSLIHNLLNGKAYRWFMKLDNWITSKDGREIALINDIIESCMEKGYLRPLNYYQDQNIERLKLTEDGYKYISWLYYPRTMWNNTHVQNTITTLINWGVPVLALWALSHFFNISISSL